MAALPGVLQLSLGLPMALPLELLLPTALVDSIRWTPAQQLSCHDCPNPTLQATQPQLLQVVITDVFGCTDTLTTQIKVDEDLNVYLPNAFSPNGDTYNDRWRIYANPLQVERVEQVLIFDRWGGLRFQATDWPINSERHGWDGTSDGQPMDPGVYAYSVTLRLVNGQRQTIGGDILLLR
jgi:gliding motility-associated-like protein